MRHDVTFPLYVEVDEIYNLACPASPIHYQFDPVQTTKTSVHGAINMLGLAKRREGEDPAGLDQRGVRRPARASADARTTGATSIRSARAPATTRASAAPRRCSSTTAASIDCASRWHASSTPTARACTPTTAGWCRTSSSRRSRASRSRSTATAARRDPSAMSIDLIDGLVRLMATADADSRARSISAIRREFTIAQLAERIIALTGSKSRDRFQAAAGGRSAAAPAGHLARREDARLETGRGARRGSGSDYRILRRAARGPATPGNST